MTHNIHQASNNMRSITIKHRPFISSNVHFLVWWNQAQVVAALVNGSPNIENQQVSLNLDNEIRCP